MSEFVSLSLEGGLKGKFQISPFEMRISIFVCLQIFGSPEFLLVEKQ